MYNIRAVEWWELWELVYLAGAGVKPEDGEFLVHKNPVPPGAQPVSELSVGMVSCLWHHLLERTNKRTGFAQPRRRSGKSLEQRKFWFVHRNPRRTFPCRAWWSNYLTAVADRNLLPKGGEEDLWVWPACFKTEISRACFKKINFFFPFLKA